MVDMSKFLPVYFEESEEQLALLETGLAALAQRTDAKALEQTVRAAHSLKGASGAFGFDAFSELAWAIEDVLRQASKGPLRLDAEMISVCRQAAVLLRDAIHRQRDKQELPLELMSQTVERLRTVMAAAASEK